jgi:hypothetical protein
MKRTRWVFGAAVAAGVVVLIAPAVSQGKVKAGSLRWSGSRREATITSYDLGARDGGARVSKGFRLRNSSLTRSGKLAIRLTGSSAFSIALDHCTGKILVARSSCFVAVTYRPLGRRASDSATLRATSEHGAAASLPLSGSNLGPSGHLYWVDEYGGTVKVVPRGGGRVKTLASGQNLPVSVAVDGTHVYWADAGDGTVNEVPLGGGSVTTLASGQSDPVSLAVDGTHVYWVDAGTPAAYFADGTVNEVPLGGGPVTTLATGQSYPDSVAVSGAHVYWANSGGTVNEVPLGGGGVTTLATTAAPFRPISMAVDGTDVYWVSMNGLDTFDGAMSKVPLGGGGVTTLATGQTNPVAVAVDGTHVYWVNAASRGNPWAVNEIPLGGGSVTPLATGQYGSDSLGGLTSVAVDGTHVYWANAGDGTVNKVPLGGGRAVTIARHQIYPYSVAVGP